MPCLQLVKLPSCSLQICRQYTLHCSVLNKFQLRYSWLMILSNDKDGLLFFVILLPCFRPSKFENSMIDHDFLLPFAISHVKTDWSPFLLPFALCDFISDKSWFLILFAIRGFISDWSWFLKPFVTCDSTPDSC